jgi:hypothetical protein
MIELPGRSFATVAAVLSFIADNSDTQESTGRSLACRRRQIQTISKMGNHTNL